MTWKGIPLFCVDDFSSEHRVTYLKGLHGKIGKGDDSCQHKLLKALDEVLVGR